MSDLAKRTITIKKTIAASIDTVWEAWTRPEHISKWWAPGGAPMSIDKFEFKVGGEWQYSMPMPNGGDFISTGVYKEIEEKRKIVTSADFKPMTEGVTLEILFEELGGSTKFIFNVIHPTEEYAKQQEAMGIYNGWGSAFDRLEQYVVK